MNLQVITSPADEILWLSGAVPGARQIAKAIHVLRACETAG